jgi:hypothetical protein
MVVTVTFANGCGEGGGSFLFKGDLEWIVSAGFEDFVSILESESIEDRENEIGVYGRRDGVIQCLSEIDDIWSIECEVVFAEERGSFVIGNAFFLCEGYSTKKEEKADGKVIC